MSAPPPPPSGDAPPPSAPATPAAPAMTPNAQFGAPVAAKSGGAKKIIFILVGVLALGGIGFAGYKYGPGLWAKYFGGGDINTPDGTIKYVLNGLADNKPEVLWEALPAKHQKLFHDEIKKAGANVDAEIQTKTIAVLKKATGVLKNKETVIKETLQAMGALEGLDKDGKFLYDNWGGIVSLLEIVVNSKSMTPEWLKNPDVGAALKEDGGKLMSSPALEKFINWGLKNDAARNPEVPKNLAEYRKWVKRIKVELVESTETTAKVKLSSVDMKIDAVDSEIDMVKVEDRWLPKEMADGMDQFITELKREMPMGQMLGSDTQMSDYQKAQLLGFLNSVDRALDTVNNATTSDDLLAGVGQVMGSLGAQFAGLEQAFGGQGGGGGIPGISGPGSGIRPGTRPGTNPGTIIPGLAPTGPPKPPGYRTEWSIGGGKYKIDEIYPGKTEAIITQVFGDPAQKQEGYWTYRGLKVRNMKLGGTYTTVIFQMQNGKVAQVIVQP